MINTTGETGAVKQHPHPYIMIGCHRNSDDTDFRDFSFSSCSVDELAFWTRKLIVNRTHDETMYFMSEHSE